MTEIYCHIKIICRNFLGGFINGLKKVGSWPLFSKNPRYSQKNGVRYSIIFSISRSLNEN